MPDPESLTQLQQQLKLMQANAKTIDTQREKLAREAGIEEHKAKEALTRLKELGVQDAGKLTVAQLEALRTETQARLEQELAVVAGKVNEANKVLAEYDAVLQAG